MVNFNCFELNDDFVNGLGVGVFFVDVVIYNNNVSGGSIFGNVINFYDFGGK